VDSGAEEGYEVLPLYDPMIAKLIVWDVDREASTKRMIRALGEYEISELKTLIPFHQALLATDQWANGETCRDLVEDKEWLKQLAFPAPEKAADEGDEPEKVSREYAVEVSGRRFDVTVIGEALTANGAGPAKKAPRRERKTGGGGGAPGELVSPIQGTVLKVAVEKGAEVDEGALICVIEAMKMENEITAPSAGTVEELGVSEGGSIATGDTIAVIK
jgi:acetyl-CoA/propionyl-CoA carboxylase, biotin carboxylase, biotin carboxyl carrier protein